MGTKVLDSLDGIQLVVDSKEGKLSVYDYKTKQVLARWEVETVRKFLEYKRPETTMEFYVAGLAHHGFEYIGESLTVGDYVLLEPEPDNKYDENAIKVSFMGARLGYVPRRITGEVRRLTHLPTEASVIEINKEDVYRGIKIGVTK
jgi:hypothetical protein